MFGKLSPRFGGGFFGGLEVEALDSAGYFKLSALALAICKANKHAGDDLGQDQELTEVDRALNLVKFYLSDGCPDGSAAVAMIYLEPTRGIDPPWDPWHDSSDRIIREVTESLEGRLGRFWIEPVNAARAAVYLAD
tara:strand:- start:675 stop:1082 length:408 start_codon:yes stop_codon:yes gene_type:complete